MAKYTVNDVQQITDNALQHVMSGVNEWTDFLIKASNFYKYNFKDILVITQTKPNATAIASFDIWSKKLHARINKGANGVPLIVNRNGRQTIEFVYDISDTNSNFKKWQADLNNTKLTDKLKQAYHITTDMSAREMLESVIDNTVLGEIAPLSENITSDIDEKQLRELLASSLSLLVLSRCGIEPAYNSSDFEYIKVLSASDVTTFGKVLTSCANSILNVVEKAVAELEKEQTLVASSTHKAEQKALTNYINTIETVKYSEPDDKNIVKPIGMITAEEAFDKLKAHLKANNLMPDDYFTLDYKGELPTDARFVCNTDFGNSEGIYIEISVISDGKSQYFATAKTLGNGYDDFIRMGRIATECSLMLNGNGIRLKREISNAQREIDFETPTRQPSRNHQPEQQRLQPQYRQSVKFTPEQLDIARNTNLVNYLSSRGEQLKRVGSSEYTMANHDSMRINENNGFYWNSRGIGGNALDFCMQYYNMDFQSAVADLLAFNGQSVDIAINRPTTPTPQTTNTTQKENVATEPYSPLLNPLSDETQRVYAYLTKTRNISPELVQQLIQSGQIAQDVKGNAIFKIFDENGNLSGAELSGTLSDKKYKNVTERNGNGFTINPLGDKTPEKAMFFESAIDALSYYSLHKDTDALLVSMAGLKDKVVLKALETHHIDFSNAIISSDIDEAGKSFAQKMQNQYGMSIRQIDTDELYASANQANLKDWNDLLQSSEQLANRGVKEYAEETSAVPNNAPENSAQVEHNFTSNVINKDYYRHLRTIGKRSYFTNQTSLSLQIAKEFEKAGIQYSGHYKDNGKLILTVHKDDEKRCAEIIKRVRSQGEKIKENTPTPEIPTVEAEEQSQQPEEITSEQISEQPLSVDNAENNIATDSNEAESSQFQDSSNISEIKLHLYRVGDFYEAYGEEAEIVAGVLDLQLVSKKIGDENIPMVGFPNHVLEAYTQRITNSGFTPVVSEQPYQSDIAIADSNSFAKDLSKAIDRLIDNHDFSEDTKKLLRRVGVAVYQNGYTSSDFKLADVLAIQNFQRNYGTVSQINEKYLNGQLDNITSELDTYLGRTPENTVINDKANIETAHKEYSLFYVEISSDIYYYRDDTGRSIEDLLKDYANSNGKLPNFTEDCTWLSVAEYAELEQSTDDSPSYSVKIDIDNNNLIVFMPMQDTIIEKPLNKTVDLVLAGGTLKDFENIEPQANYFALEDTNLKQSETAVNFKITDTEVDTEVTSFSPKEKYRNNIEAIETLISIEAENRTATPDEQAILAKYVGWGGLADTFDESKTAWKNEYTELKELLTDSEYTSARASTLNAHYTAPEIISAMYQAIENLGFQNGKVLEPAMGIGNFFGRLPDSMQQSKLYGVELDSISGRIAKQLYPNSNIQIKGFEKTDFTSNTFDVAIGNVPFGDIPIYDKDFKGSNLIHDYFFKKALDKVRPNGVIAFITSKGTLDKQDNSVRKYLAERAELLGAIRLPNNAFKNNAGTEVTSDIIFLQKREMPIELSEANMPEWVNLAENDNGISMNSYFVNHPEMILGEMSEIMGRFGLETACLPIDGVELSEQLNKAVANIKGDIGERNVEMQVDTAETPSNIIPENYRNYCFSVINNDIYYREGDKMVKQNFDSKKTARIKGMVELSETLRELIRLQKDDCSDSEIKAQQDKLNLQYNKFTSKYGLISDSKNKSAFKSDDTSPLLFSLENVNDKGELVSKADIFDKRTIVPYRPIEHVDTPSEALAVSISEKAGVDLDYMSQLCSKTKEEIIEELKGVIFENPATNQYETADEYLSGNVREKLKIATHWANEGMSKYETNVEYLTAVQPEELKPSEIFARLGSTWIPTKYYEQFMYELLETPISRRSTCPWRNMNKDAFSNGFMSDNTTIMVAFDESTSTYGISNKMGSNTNGIKANITYGTSRVNAYKIIEDSLNLKTVKVMDTIEMPDGKKRSVINQKETELAQAKQKQIKQAFQEWVFDDFERTEDLCKIYNERFNSVRVREYDGSHLTFGGINPEIKLRQHQINAIAHTIYGGNTLLAHSVGAGKTFEMVASAMESKRLGLCNKSLIVVPKHIVNQVAKEFLQLYPTANILVPDEKDFSKANRERFCSRIATGNYDAIIISHTQLEKIPLSKARQVEFIQNQINETVEGIAEFKSMHSERGFSIKQLEATKKKLEARLEKLNNDDKRDTTITFEELGIDKLFVDEAHLFKNLYFTSKMTNVSGINTSSVAQRATDLFMKCRYLDEKTGSRGVVFATGTPVSNSMAELYTMQKYLQNDKLKEQGLSNFDAWASTFGENITDFVLAPEGTGFQLKTRFAKFFNLPELMSMFKEVADIKTADELNLPVPKANYHSVVTEASEWQHSMVDGLAERANRIRMGGVDAREDNMLNVTNDGRKLALDQRLINADLPEDKNSKVNKCIDNVFEIWQNTTDKKGTQMIFCDLSTPHYDGTFSVYDNIKNSLIEKGIPDNEIAFIHDCKTDEQKQALFSKVRNGDVRVLIGSTTKMGTGTNCQDKLLALHHIDCPWRPSDLEQRNGRIIRQGNTNAEVDIYNYVTKGTFDAYLYQTVENKQRFISQIMTSKSPVRSAEDVDETVLNYAQIKAIATGNPLIKEKMDLEVEVATLRNIFASYQDNRRQLQSRIATKYPAEIQADKSLLNLLKMDAKLAESTKSENFVGMTVNGVLYTDKKEAGTAFKQACFGIDPHSKNTVIGEYRGFEMYANFNKATSLFMVTLKGNAERTIDISGDVFGNITRLNNVLDNGINKVIKNISDNLANTQTALDTAKKEVDRPFAQMDELKEKEARLDELNKILSPDNEEISKNGNDEDNSEPPFGE